MNSSARISRRIARIWFFPFGLLFVWATWVPCLFVQSFSSKSPTTRNHNAAPNNQEAQPEPSATTFRQLRITFVTGNEMKAKEMNRILADHGATKGRTPETSLVHLNVLNVDLPEIQEVDTIAIAKEKALLAAQLANGPCLVEDTSLKFHALGGMPGPYIKVRNNVACDWLCNVVPG